MTKFLALAIAGCALLALAPTGVVALNSPTTTHVAYIRTSSASSDALYYLYEIRPVLDGSGSSTVHRVVGTNSSTFYDDFTMDADGNEPAWTAANVPTAVAFYWPHAGTTLSSAPYTGHLIGAVPGGTLYRFAPGAVGASEDWVLGSDGYVASINTVDGTGHRQSVQRISWTAASDALVAQATPLRPATGAQPVIGTSQPATSSGSPDFYWSPCFNVLDSQKGAAGVNTTALASATAWYNAGCEVLSFYTDAEADTFGPSADAWNHPTPFSTTAFVVPVDGLYIHADLNLIGHASSYAGRTDFSNSRDDACGGTMEMEAVVKVFDAWSKAVITESRHTIYEDNFAESSRTFDWNGPWATTDYLSADLAGREVAISVTVESHIRAACAAFFMLNGEGTAAFQRSEGDTTYGFLVVLNDVWADEVSLA